MRNVYRRRNRYTDRRQLPRNLCKLHTEHGFVFVGEDNAGIGLYRHFRCVFCLFGVFPETRIDEQLDTVFKTRRDIIK